MNDIRFAEIMQRERERLSREREEIFNQQRDLENKLTEINRELAAVDAYEAAKTGKAATPGRRPRGPRTSAAAVKQSSAEIGARPRAGSRREALLQVIREQQRSQPRRNLCAHGSKGGQIRREVGVQCPHRADQGQPGLPQRRKIRVRWVTRCRFHERRS